jgi:hypothetical protein
MRRLWVVFFFCAGILSAQELADVTLYFAPATGGTPEDRAFFDITIPKEIRSPHYIVVDSPEAADFLVSLVITDNEDEGNSMLTLGLTAAAASETLLLELSWHYVDVEEMYRWDIGSILAPAGRAETAAVEPPAETADWGARRRRLYAGVLGGVSFTRRSFQAAAGHYYSMGISAEGGAVVELRLFRYLGFQTGGNFVYEEFESPGDELTGGTRATDTFTVMSLMFPVMVKVPLSFGRITLGLYAGGCYTLALGDARKKSGASGETEAVQLTVPFGFIMGADVGFIMGRGELFGDLRYGRDFGGTVIGEGLVYNRDRVSLYFGYKFGF